MNAIFSLVMRNSKIYFRDKSAVFFSLLSVLIIIMLYALFLGKTNTNAIKAQVGDVSGINVMVSSWIMAGIIIINSITVSLAVFGTMVKDQEEKRLGSFLVAPISRSKLVLGYLISTWFVSFLLTMFAFILAEIYIVASGGTLLPLASIIKAVGVIIINVFSSTSMVFLLIIFIKSSRALSALSTILGTLVGFLTGIYVPIGILPESVQMLTKLIPATYSTSLMRQIFLVEVSRKVFENAPVKVLESYNKLMGNVLYFGANEVSEQTMIVIILMSGLLFLCASILIMKHRKNG